MGRVTGKVAIVTGGTSGIGSAVAELLAEQGASVVLTGRRAELGEAMSRKIGSSARFVRQDVASREDWQRVLAEAQQAFGPVTILVNNAGASPMLPMAEISEAVFREVFETNQLGVFLGMQTVTPSMQDAGGGSIINVSSVAGLVGFSHLNAYNGAKFAVRGMTKGAAIELGPMGIRVNTVHPGPVLTEPLEKSFANQPDEKQRLEESLPLRRVGAPREVANLILFLASDESSYCTGAEFIIDGGMTCQ